MDKQTNSKTKLHLYKKEQLVICILVLCFVMSGYCLPKIKNQLYPPQVSQETTDSEDIIIDKENIQENIFEESPEIIPDNQENIYVESEELPEEDVPSEQFDSNDSSTVTKPSDNSSQNSQESQNEEKPQESQKEEKPKEDKSQESQKEEKPKEDKPQESQKEEKPKEDKPQESQKEEKPKEDKPQESQKEEKPQEDEKTWIPPVYETIHHEAVYETVRVVICNYCSEEFSSVGEFQVHKDANGGWAGLHTTCRAVSKEVLIQEAWDEEVLISEGYYK